MERVTADDGVELRFRVDGPAEGTPILFLHSIGCDHRMWEPQAAALARRGRRPIRPDLRGHGGSGAPAGDYSLARLARDALAVLDALDAGPTVVCGLSLGGLAAQELALRAPDRVAALALANTDARIGTPQAWRERAAQVRTQGLDSIADMAMARFFSEDFRARDPATVALFRERLLGGSAQGYAACCAVLRDADLSGEIGALNRPVLVIGGRLDVSTPPARMRELALAMPTAAYLELDAAHLSNVERPEAFTAAILEFLETL
jgi:3-oxoadipate enol-lactonase